jgi:hypothetical protein
MTETKTPDPGCTLCGGTGLQPPFLDPCLCTTAPTKAMAPSGRWKAGPIGDPTPSWAAPTPDTDAAVLAAATVRTDTTIAETKAAAATPYASVTAADLDKALDGWDDVPVAAEHAAVMAADLAAERDKEAAAAGARVAHPGGKGITTAQITLLKRLAAERDPEHVLVKGAIAIALAPTLITAATASLLIDKLMTLPKVTEVPRPNKWAGVCRICRTPVDAGAGAIVQIDGKWKTQHLDGKCATAAETAVAEASRVDEPGLYTLIDGSDTLIFRVRKSRTSSRLYAERVITSVDDDGVTTVAFGYDGKAIHLLSKYGKLTWAEARDFGALVGACVACGRTLSDARSVVQGYGATCAAHWRWPTVSAKTAEQIIAGAVSWEDAIASKGFI